ncbi:MAG: radical SAM family heme chaperone HemW [Planctomycetota bacterium]
MIQTSRGLHAEWAGGAAALTPASLYIHIPFCFHKCHYCDFYSIVDTQDRQDVFTERLIAEVGAISAAAQGQPLRTVFVGGGTPTLLRADLWERLGAALGERFDLSAIRRGEPGTEFTVECNPETADERLFGVLRSAGVNRLSIGAQSFDPEHLKTLERHHDPLNVERTLTLARAAGIERASVDLIYAVPGQSVGSWRRDLETALGLGVRHLSAYNLTYEPRTAMTARLERGLITPTDEDTEVAMFELTRDLTRRAGLERYEVSNYAAAGEVSHHNLSYWRQDAWLAAGPSASGHAVVDRGGAGRGGHRWKNTARLDTYLRVSDDGFSAVEDYEAPDPLRAIAEVVMTGLRLAEGVDADDVLERARSIDGARADRLESAIQPAVRRGHLVDGPVSPRNPRAGRRWVLTDDGFLFADGIASDCIEALMG